jgi:PKD repeat protein
MRMFTRPALLALLVGAAACSVQETTIPQLTGPSEMSLRVAVQVTPDSIFQDGASQAVLNIEASGGDGRPMRGLSLRVETEFNGVLQDFGTLSAKTVATGDDGRTRVVYTAAPRPSQPVDEFTIVTFRVTPIGGDYRGEFSRTVDLRLLTPGILLPPNPGAPQPSFTYSPTNAAILQSIVFDASATTDDGVSCPQCTYRWDFGDGETATGIFATHMFKTPGTFQVRLTVTDTRGASTTQAQNVVIGGGAEPKADFTFSPEAPEVSQLIYFTAEASRAAVGRRIVSYDWNFGSGRTGTGITTSKGYDTPGSYVVTLTVTDDAGNQGTTSKTVKVGDPQIGPRPALTASLTATSLGAGQFSFDASGSRGPDNIVEYRFRFSDGTPDHVSTTAASVTHTYTTSGAYVVTVIVKDSVGRTATASAAVNVP